MTTNIKALFLPRVKHFPFWLGTYKYILAGNICDNFNGQIVNSTLVVNFRLQHGLFMQLDQGHFLSLVRSKLRLCSANHRPGYWSNLPCDWPSTAWAYSEQDTEKWPRSSSPSDQLYALSGSRNTLTSLTGSNQLSCGLYNSSVLIYIM